MTTPSTSLSRRQVCSTVGALGASTALAGCSALWDQTGATDVALRNVADESLTVSVTITSDGADGPHTEATVDLAAHEFVPAVNDSKLPTNGSYAVDVDVEGGPNETFEWEDPTVELAPLHVVVDGGDNVDFLLKAG